MKSSSYNFEWLLEVGEGEEEYDVHFLYYPPMRGERERSSGLQLSPDAPAEIEITGIFDSAGVDHYGVLFSQYKDKLEEDAWEYLESLRDADY